MNAIRKLNNALESIGKVKNNLKRLQNEVQDDTQIRYAISDLDDAENDLTRVIKELKNTI